MKNATTVTDLSNKLNSRNWSSRNLKNFPDLLFVRKVKFIRLILLSNRETKILKHLPVKVNVNGLSSEILNVFPFTAPTLRVVDLIYVKSSSNEAYVCWYKDCCSMKLVGGRYEHITWWDYSKQWRILRFVGGFNSLVHPEFKTLNFKRIVRLRRPHNFNFAEQILLLASFSRGCLSDVKKLNTITLNWMKTWTRKL